MFLEANETEWQELMERMPPYFPGGDTPEEAFIKPGNCVKSAERGVDGMPVHHGRLLHFSTECVIVLGFGDCVSPKFVWRGNDALYHLLWRVD